MPVIRVQSTYRALPPEHFAELVNRVKAEREGSIANDGPTIFEIPIGSSELLDVMVVWDAFKDVSMEERLKIILAAYHDWDLKISQAFGVTLDEAMQDQLLPYSITHHDMTHQIGEAELNNAMLREGAFRLRNGKLSLQFPNRAMAEQIKERLAQQFKTVYWQVEEFVSQIYE